MLWLDWLSDFCAIIQKYKFPYIWNLQKKILFQKKYISIIFRFQEKFKIKSFKNFKRSTFGLLWVLWLKEDSEFS